MRKEANLKYIVLFLFWGRKLKRVLKETITFENVIMNKIKTKKLKNSFKAWKKNVNLKFKLKNEKRNIACLSSICAVNINKL